RSSRFSIPAPTSLIRLPISLSPSNSSKNISSILECIPHKLMPSYRSGAISVNSTSQNSEIVPSVVPSSSKIHNGVYSYASVKIRSENSEIHVPSSNSHSHTK